MARDIWKHGTYIDLWSVVHLGSGALLGSLFFYFGINFFWSGIITLALLILWELFEVLIKINESRKNVLADIIIGMAGFYIIGYLHYSKGWPWSPHFFFSLLFVTGGLSLWGFLDFLKRGYR